MEAYISRKVSEERKVERQYNAIDGDNANKSHTRVTSTTIQAERTLEE
jgi:hypothetical protein